MEVCRQTGQEAGRGGGSREGAWPCLQSPRPLYRGLLLIGFPSAGLRILSPAERSAGERTGLLSGWFGADRLPRHRPRVPTRHRAEPLRQPPSQPRTPDIKHGLLHRERLLQAGRRHSRHPSGRSGCQRCRCQNPGEFPGPHGEEEDKERRARPEGPGPRGTRRSWGRPGRRGRRPQRRLGQD